jgi:hypothetical protein
MFGVSRVGAVRRLDARRWVPMLLGEQLVLVGVVPASDAPCFAGGERVVEALLTNRAAGADGTALVGLGRCARVDEKVQ